jgi:hypothetical protein
VFIAVFFQAYRTVEPVSLIAFDKQQWQHPTKQETKAGHG